MANEILIIMLMAWLMKANAIANSWNNNGNDIIIINNNNQYQYNM
jgi:hypothetical protein